MDLTTHQAQATNHTRPDTTPIHAQANTIHARSDTTPEAMHARLGTTPEANLQEGQSRLATASKGSRMANALDTRPDACRRTIEEIKADLDKNLAARMKDNPLLSDCETITSAAAGSCSCAAWPVTARPKNRRRHGATNREEPPKWLLLLATGVDLIVP